MVSINVSFSHYLQMFKDISDTGSNRDAVDANCDQRKGGSQETIFLKYIKC